MFRRQRFGRLLSLPLLLIFATPVLAENDGQEDLDKATQLKISAETLDDLAKVIDRLDSAIEKGLDKENSKFAEELLVASLLQRGTLFSTAVFNMQPEDPQRGMRLMQFRSWALTDLQRAVELEGNLVEAQMLIGKLQSLPLGDTSAARRAFSKVTKAADAPPELKAEAFALRSNVQSDEAKQLEDLNQAVELQPEKPDYIRLRANYLYGKEKFDESLADVDRALKLEPEHAGTNELRGMVLLSLEKYDEALASFDKASEIAPEAALPYQHRGELYRQKGDLEKAVEQLNKALELSPDNVATLLFRAGVYYKLDQMEHALEDVEKAIKIEPRFVHSHLMKAEIYAATDRLSDAIVQLERLLQAAPGNVDVLKRLGNFYLLSGRPRKSIEALTQVLQLDPDDYESLRFRADAYLGIGQHAEAIADFDQAFQLNEEDESLLNNFAWVLATSPDDKVRNGERALKLATKAAEVTGHQTPHVLSTLGAAYAETGDFENAKKWSKQAVELAQKAVDSAENDEARTKLKTDVEQLQKEFDSYQEGKPVRERQNTEEAAATPATEAPATEAPAAEEPPAETPPDETAPADEETPAGGEQSPTPPASPTAQSDSTES